MARTSVWIAGLALGACVPTTTAERIPMMEKVVEPDAPEESPSSLLGVSLGDGAVPLKCSPDDLRSVKVIKDGLPSEGWLKSVGKGKAVGSIAETLKQQVTTVLGTNIQPLSWKGIQRNFKRPEPEARRCRTLVKAIETSHKGLLMATELAKIAKFAEITVQSSEQLGVEAPTGCKRLLLEDVPLFERELLTSLTDDRASFSMRSADLSARLDALKRMAALISFEHRSMWREMQDSHTHDNSMKAWKAQIDALKMEYAAEEPDAKYKNILARLPSKSSFRKFGKGSVAEKIYEDTMNMIYLPAGSGSGESEEIDSKIKTQLEAMHMAMESATVLLFAELFAKTSKRMGIEPSMGCKILIREEVPLFERQLVKSLSGGTESFRAGRAGLSAKLGALKSMTKLIYFERRSMWDEIQDSPRKDTFMKAWKDEFDALGMEYATEEPDPSYKSILASLPSKLWLERIGKFGLMESIYDAAVDSIYHAIGTSLRDDEGEDMRMSNYLDGLTMATESTKISTFAELCVKTSSLMGMEPSNRCMRLLSEAVPLFERQLLKSLKAGGEASFSRSRAGLLARLEALKSMAKLIRIEQDSMWDQIAESPEKESDMKAWKDEFDALNMDYATEEADPTYARILAGLPSESWLQKTGKGRAAETIYEELTRTIVDSIGSTSWVDKETSSKISAYRDGLSIAVESANIHMVAELFAKASKLMGSAPPIGSKMLTKAVSQFEGFLKRSVSGHDFEDSLEHAHEQLEALKRATAVLYAVQASMWEAIETTEDSDSRTELQAVKDELDVLSIKYTPKLDPEHTRRVSDRVKAIDAILPSDTWLETVGKDRLAEKLYNELIKKVGESVEHGFADAEIGFDRHLSLLNMTVDSANIFMFARLHLRMAEALGVDRSAGCRALIAADVPNFEAILDQSLQRGTFADKLPKLEQQLGMMRNMVKQIHHDDVHSAGGSIWEADGAGDEGERQLAAALKKELETLKMDYVSAEPETRIDLDRVAEEQLVAGQRMMMHIFHRAAVA